MAIKIRVITILTVLTALLAAAPAASGQSAKGLRTVVIDPGHGGKDPGALGLNKATSGYHEKDIVLAISLLLGEKIQKAYPDVKVMYTRKTDVFITRNDRAKMANTYADLFISIHCNGNANLNANGTSVHILGQSRDPKRDLYAGKMDVSRRENSVILLEDDYSTDYQGFDPNSPESFIFFNLMQNAYYEQSVLFASLVDQQLRKTAFAISNYTGIHQDPFWLLWKTAMPAVLIELGFISNPADLKVLNSENGRNDIANKLFSAFKSFKTSYDSSLNAKTETSAPVQQTVAEQKPAPKEEQPAPQKTIEENVYYGVQIMGLGRLLKNGDPALKGLETQAVKSPDSSIYKYVVGKYSDREAAVKSLPAVKKKFPEAFPVKVEGTTVSRLR